MGNRTLLQFFHWYYPDGGKLWNEVAEKAGSLAKMGVTDVWLPPIYKGAAGGFSVGYDTYDLFDIGEFEQKGTVATKYGDRAGLINACDTLKASGVKVMLDVVFNHKMGADEKEAVRIRRVDQDDRTKIDDEEIEALAYTRFTFPGRAGQHSKFIWDQKCFSGVDVIEQPDESGIFRLVNEYGDGEWNDQVDDENGNFDYLMGADVEFRNRAVCGELKFWGRWVSEQLPVDGFRLDAAKHIPAWFFKDWVGHVRETVSNDLFVVAEYWHPDMGALKEYLDLVDNQLTLFDVALHHRFHHASKQGGEFDMRTIFDGSLAAAHPGHAVTIVDNHDTQPLQSLEATVDPWFKPLAYALILLREEGTPCVFYPDLYGAHYTDEKEGETHEIDMPAIGCLSALIEARTRFAHGPQTEIFDDAHCVGFARQGTDHAPGCVVVMSNQDEAAKTFELGEHLVGKTFVDFLGHREDRIVVGADSKASFPTNAGSVSVWVVEGQ